MRYFFLDSKSVLSSYSLQDDPTASVVLTQLKRSIPFSFLRHNSRYLVVVGEFQGTSLLMTWKTLVIKIHCEFKQVMDCQDKKLRRKPRELWFHPFTWSNLKFSVTRT